MTSVALHNRIARFIFFIYVVLLVVQDLPLQESLGTIARSPYIFLSPVIFVLIVFQSGRLFNWRMVNIYAGYFFYSLFISVGLLVYYLGIEQIGNHVYGENLVVKLAKSATYNFILILTFYNFLYIFSNCGHRFSISVLRWVVWVQVFAGLVQLVYPDALLFLKTPGLNPSERLSLLSSEPSSAFPLLLISVLLYAFYKGYMRQALSWPDIFLFGFSLLLLLMVQSRGGLVIALLCAIVVILFTRQNARTKLITVSAMAAAAIPVVYVIMEFVVPSLILDIEEFNSVSTRSITIVAGFVSLVEYPFGQGYSTYLITFPALLADTTNWVLSAVNVPLLTYEIDEMIMTGKALAVKSGLLNEVLFTGWVVIVFYILLFKNVYRNIAESRLSAGLKLLCRLIVLFIIVNYLLVSTMETSYIVFLPFAIFQALTIRQNVSPTLNEYTSAH